MVCKHNLVKTCTVHILNVFIVVTHLYLVRDMVVLGEDTGLSFRRFWV